MTLNDLKKEVATLGFESEIELDDAFIYCANRALYSIFTERPVKRTVRLPIVKTPYKSHTDCIIHHSGEVISLPIACKCMYFRVSGAGSFVLSNREYQRRTDFDTPDSVFKIFADEFSEIRFDGDFYFSVFDLTLYDECFGETEDTIPEYTGMITVDLNERLGDFLSFTDTPKTSGGAEAEFLSMQNGIITLPYSSEDEITLTYARLPKKIYPDEPDTRIDISGECEVLLPLLCASYLWLDDESDKAQYYMDLYRTEMNFIRRYITSSSTSEYQDVMGWA